MKTLLIVGLSLGLFGCASVRLKSEANDITLFQHEPLASCDFLGQVKGDDSSNTFLVSADPESAKNQMLNSAAELGANSVRYLKSSNTHSYSVFFGAAFKCVNPVDSTSDQLGTMCEQNNPAACFDLSEIDQRAGSRRHAEQLLNKACKLGNQKACQIQAKFGLDDDSLKKGAALAASCSRCKTKACLEISFFLYQFTYRTEALKYAQAACGKGEKEGCTFYTKIMDENREAATAQTMRENRESQNSLENQRQAFLLLQLQQQNDQAVTNSFQNFSNAFKEPAESAPTKINCSTRQRTLANGQVINDTQCQ